MPAPPKTHQRCLIAAILASSRITALLNLLLQDERDQLRARLEDALLTGGVGPEAALGRGVGAGLNPQVGNRH
jgi:hypothetical protein